MRPFEDVDFATRGFVKGYVGPQGFDENVQVFADLTVRGGKDWVTGSNTVDRHVTGANAGRDFRVDRWEDLVEFREGDRCPIDGGTLHIGRSIVVGHIYQLGTNFSGPLDATFVDEDDSEKPYVMGSYGIGIEYNCVALVKVLHETIIDTTSHVCTILAAIGNEDDNIVASDRLAWRRFLNGPR